MELSDLLEQCKKCIKVLNKQEFILVLNQFGEKLSKLSLERGGGSSLKEILL